VAVVVQVAQEVVVAILEPLKAALAALATVALLKAQEVAQATVDQMLSEQQDQRPLLIQDQVAVVVITQTAAPAHLV
jgi:hypothetical protein